MKVTVFMVSKTHWLVVLLLLSVDLPHSATLLLFAVVQLTAQYTVLVHQIAYSSEGGSERVSSATHETLSDYYVTNSFFLFNLHYTTLT